MITLKKWLQQKAAVAMQIAGESRLIERKTWIAGYDCGYADALSFLCLELPQSILEQEFEPHRDSEITEQV